MSCCWRPVAQQQAAFRASDGNPIPYRNGRGIIELHGYEDCLQPYSGPRRAEVVYIVGWSTEHEKLFASTDAKQAVIYRNETDPSLSIEQVQAGNLCSDAVEQLWG